MNGLYGYSGSMQGQYGMNNMNQMNSQQANQGAFRNVYGILG